MAMEEPQGPHDGRRCSHWRLRHERDHEPQGEHRSWHHKAHKWERHSHEQQDEPSDHAACEASRQRPAGRTAQQGPPEAHHDHREDVVDPEKRMRQAREEGAVRLSVQMGKGRGSRNGQRSGERKRGSDNRLLVADPNGAASATLDHTVQGRAAENGMGFGVNPLSVQPDCNLHVRSGLILCPR